MDNAEVEEGTSLQSARYRYLKCGISPEKVMVCIFPGLHAFSEVWLKLNENCGSSIKSSLFFKI